jgi:hypothetical protein
LGILSKIEKNFSEWSEGSITEKAIAVTGIFCLFIFISFWFIIYLITIPIKWLWVHRLKEGVKSVLSEDSLKQYNKERLFDLDR